MKSDDIKALAKRALERAAKEASEKPERPKPLKVSKEVYAFLKEEPEAKSEDALDKRAFRKGGFSKAEKRAYAQQKFVEDLVLPPKNPPPAWLSDPSLLPKKPPKAE